MNTEICCTNYVVPPAISDEVSLKWQKRYFDTAPHIRTREDVDALIAERYEALKQKANTDNTQGLQDYETEDFYD